MRGCAGGKGVLQSRIAAGELILRPPAESSSLALPGSGRGRPGRDEGRGNREELWCAALRHGFGKGCLGEAGGTSQKKAPLGGFFDPGRFRSAGTGAQIWGKEKSPEHHSAPGLCLWQERSVSIANCMVSQKREGACVGEPQVPATDGAKRKSPPQRAAFGYAKCLGVKRKRHLSVPFFFWCGRWDSNPHTEVLASKTRASTIPPLPLISLWPCTFAKQQADKYPYYTIFSLGLSIPRPVPTVRGLPVYRRCVRIES